MHQVQSFHDALLYITDVSNAVCTNELAIISQDIQKLKVIFSIQWRNKVAVGPRASIPKGPPLPQKNFQKKQRPANFGPPTALGLRALHALLLRHCLDNISRKYKKK